MPELELIIFDLVTSANKLITGRWRGRQLGLVRVLAAAARRNGVVFSVTGVAHRSWGRGPKSKLKDPMRASNDLKQFTSSLHLAARKIGAWPVLMAGTQTSMSFGWIIRYLYDFTRALPTHCEFHHAVGSSSSEMEEEQSGKRKIEQATSPDE